MTLIPVLGTKSYIKFSPLPKIFPTRFCFTFMRKNIRKKSSKIFKWPEMCPLGEILAQDFQMEAVTKILRQQDISIAPLLSLGDKHKTLGDCDAAIQPKLLPLTHAQSLSQEVGSGDEELGLFGFHLPSEQKRTFGGWKRSRRRSQNQYMTSTWGQWLQKKLEDMSAAPDELHHACREARDFASHFHVSYDIFMFVIEAPKPVFSVCTHDGGCAYKTAEPKYTHFNGGIDVLSVISHSIRIFVELLSLLSAQQKWYHHLPQVQSLVLYDYIQYTKVMFCRVSTEPYPGYLPGFYPYPELLWVLCHLRTPTRTSVGSVAHSKPYPGHLWGL